MRISLPVSRIRETAATTEYSGNVLHSPVTGGKCRLDQSKYETSMLFRKR